MVNYIQQFFSIIYIEFELIEIIVTIQSYLIVWVYVLIINGFIERFTLKEIL